MTTPLSAGRVEVILGPMFAGKTEELLRRVRRARIAGRRVEIVNHALDTRRGEGVVSSHSGIDLPSRTVATAGQILDLISDTANTPGASTSGTHRPDDVRLGVDLLAIDEAQFFGPDLVDVVQQVADQGIVVVVAGLDVTFDGLPFAPLPALAALAERVDKLTAVCMVCGNDAAFHVRLDRADPEQAPDRTPDPLQATSANVGGAEKYQARCRLHFTGAPWRSGASSR